MKKLAIIGALIVAITIGAGYMYYYPMSWIQGERWSHAELIEHLNKQALSFTAEPTQYGTFAGEAMIFHLPDSRNVYVQLRKTSAEAKDAAGTKGETAFAWGRFFFSGEKAGLRQIMLGLGLIKPSDINPSKFMAGPVEVSKSKSGNCLQHPDTTPCENAIELRYNNQALKVEDVGYYQFGDNISYTLSADDVVWVDNRYVSISYFNGGNCWGCEGVEVVSLDGGKLYPLGKFKRIEDGYLVTIYDRVELNGVTSHAGAPSWFLYLKSKEDDLILDTEKTCAMAKDEYDKDKNELIRVLLTRSQNIQEPLFRTLALSKFCFWFDEYKTVTAMAETSDIIVEEDWKDINAALDVIKAGYPDLRWREKLRTQER